MIQTGHASWLISSNSRKYDIEAAFDTTKVITWGLTVSLNVGDIVYVYVSAPESRIKYRCIVDKVNVAIDDRLGAEFWITPFESDRKLINLRLMAELNSNELTAGSLINEGYILSAPQGPRKVPKKLEDFLSSL